MKRQTTLWAIAPLAASIALSLHAQDQDITLEQTLQAALTQDQCQAVYSASDQTLLIPCVSIATNNAVIYSARLKLVNDSAPVFSIMEIQQISNNVSNSNCKAMYSEGDKQLYLPCVAESKADGNLIDIGGFNLQHDINLNQITVSNRFYPSLVSSHEGNSNRRSVVAFTGKGIDSCALPTVNQLQTWYDNSPYKVVNLYIGGQHRYSGCISENDARITKENLLALSQQGWKFVPTWVGVQPLYGTLSKTNAYNQGVAEADSAIAKAKELGLARADGSNTIIYYDVEGYNDSTYREATKALIQGWTDKLHEYNSKSGVYGSLVQSKLIDFAGITDAVWIGEYWYQNYSPSNPIPQSVFDLLTRSSSVAITQNMWSNQQRILQYNNTHNETYGGVTLSIDSDLIDGLVANVESPSTSTATNLTYFDGAGSLISPTQSGSGANNDVDMMHANTGRTSTVVFQFLNDSSGKCHHVDISSSIGEAIIQAKSWGAHEVPTAYRGSLPISVKSEGSWTVVAVTSTAPLSGSASVYATCKTASDSFTSSYNNRTALDMKLIPLDLDYYWTGTGSIMSQLGTGTGKTNDVVPTFNAHKSLSSFQWYASSICKKLKIYGDSNPVSLTGDNEVAIKNWSADKSGWSSNLCSSLPCTISSPNGNDGYYVVKIKTNANAIPSGYLNAACIN